MNKRTILGIACAAAVALFGAGTAKAGSVTLNGYVFANNSNVGNAVEASLPGGTFAASLSSADVTFSVTTSSSIDFDSRFGSGDYILSNWLATGGATGVTALTSAGTTALSSNMSNGGYVGDLILLEGTINITSGETFAFAHDDGASMYINGTNIFSDGGPTAPVLSNFTYSGPTLSGATLDIVYGECCTAPAVLDTNIPTGGNAPEPGTLALFGTGLLVLGGAFRRHLLG